MYSVFSDVRMMMTPVFRTVTENIKQILKSVRAKKTVQMAVHVPITRAQEQPR